jgi:hypothetical protein
MLVKELLLSSNYWVMNKNVVKTFGIETAFLLTNLAEAEQMMSTDDGWFYQTSDTLEELTTLSRYKQDNAIEQLENAGILEKDVRGIPAKRYFKLDYKALANKIVNNSQTSVQKNDKQVFKKLATNKESTNKQSNRQSIESPDSAKAKYDDDSPYLGLAKYLFTKVKENNSKAREPNFQNWADDIRKLVEIDRNTVEEVKEVIDWCQSDSFWKNNVMSANKLRNQFPKLWGQGGFENKGSIGIEDLWEV